MTNETQTPQKSMIQNMKREDLIKIVLILLGLGLLVVAYIYGSYLDCLGGVK
jgi:hypothetical protein